MLLNSIKLKCKALQRCCSKLTLNMETAPFESTEQGRDYVRRIKVTTSAQM